MDDKQFHACEQEAAGFVVAESRSQSVRAWPHDLERSCCCVSHDRRAASLAGWKALQSIKVCRQTV